MVTLKLTRTGSSNRSARSFEEKVRALELFENEGLSRTEAMIKAAEEFETPSTKSMNDRRCCTNRIRRRCFAGPSQVRIA